MEKQGLIGVVLLRNHRPFAWEEGQEETFAPGRATRFRPTHALIQLAEDNGIKKPQSTSTLSPIFQER
jgi:hypothetical protein